MNDSQTRFGPLFNHIPLHSSFEMQIKGVIRATEFPLNNPMKGKVFYPKGRKMITFSDRQHMIDLRLKLTAITSKKFQAFHFLCLFARETRLFDGKRVRSTQKKEAGMMMTTSLPGWLIKNHVWKECLRESCAFL